MKKEKLRELIQQGADLSSDHDYLCYKTPEVLEALRQVKKVPKDLQDEYDDVLRNLEYINDTM